MKMHKGRGWVDLLKQEVYRSVCKEDLHREGDQEQISQNQHHDIKINNNKMPKIQKEQLYSDKAEDLQIWLYNSI